MDNEKDENNVLDTNGYNGKKNSDSSSTKVIMYQEESSISSNESGGESNESPKESTFSQTSSTNRQSTLEVSTLKNLCRSSSDGCATKPTVTQTKEENSRTEKMQMENTKKKSHSILRRSVSTISTKLLSSTLPRLSSSHSLSDQGPSLTTSSSINEEKIKTDDPYGEVARGLEFCYRKVLLPFEEKCMFHQFHYAKYDDCEFEAKPFVLLIGQYSTGKSSFIRYMAGEDYPGINIGPEPTTDRFTIILHGKERKVITGNSLVMHKKLPFRSLQKFGNTFLSRLQCSLVDSNMLNGLALVDTPGILSGQKKVGDERGYDFPGVLEWFAERVDRILVLFDAHKLDISEEFHQVLNSLKNYEEKVRIVLNKSDMLEPQSLFRVYGSLMWSLGKTIKCPEAVRVYVGSFWDEPYQFSDWKQLFEDEQLELFQDLKTLPQMSASRKINDFSKRAKLAKAHALVLAELRRQMPTMSFFKERKKQEIIENLENTYRKIQIEHDVSAGDFPNPTIMKEKLAVLDWSRFRDTKKRDVEKLDKMLNSDLANLISAIPTVGDLRHGGEFHENPQRKKSGGTRNLRRRGFNANGVNKERKVTGFEYANEIEFEIPYRKKGEWQRDDYSNGNTDAQSWVIQNWLVCTSSPEKFNEWCGTFEVLNPIDGKVSGKVGKLALQESGLSNSTLKKIWNLADVNKDGMLDCNEFCLAMYLVDLSFGGNIELPKELPTHLYPPTMMPKYKF